MNKDRLEDLRNRYKSATGNYINPENFIRIVDQKIELIKQPNKEELLFYLILLLDIYKDDNKN
ncbi:hypothetical protein V6O07_23275 [Arthrospira platensis SPKY2]